MIGFFSDSHGDLDAFDAAYELLKKKGAKRFFFAGGRYSDLDEWIIRKKEKARGGRAYNDSDFLQDITSWLGGGTQVERGPVFGQAPEEPTAAATPAADDLNRIKDKFVRTPEKDSLQYRDPNVENKKVDMIGNHLCCIVHDKNDLNKEDLLNSTFFFHGKESEPKVVQFGPRFFITPGKLVGAAEQTCALIELVEKTLKFVAFTLDGKVLVEQPYNLGTKTKLSVK